MLKKNLQMKDRGKQQRHTTQETASGFITMTQSESYNQLRFGGNTKLHVDAYALIVCYTSLYLEGVPRIV